MEKTKTSASTIANKQDDKDWQDFEDGVARLIKNRNAEDSLLEKRLGKFGAELAREIMVNHPLLTVEQAIEDIENMT